MDVTGSVRFFSGIACDALEQHREVECIVGASHTMTSECDTNDFEPRITDNCEDARSEPVHSRPSYRTALLSSKDCKSTLEPFFSNADKNAEVVDAMHITHLHSWFEASKWKMSAAQLSESQQVSIICQKLQGPILSAFMHASRISGQPNTLAELRTALSQLFAESSVKFTDKALRMVFQPKNLVKDIRMFATFVEHSSLAASADHNEFFVCNIAFEAQHCMPEHLSAGQFRTWPSTESEFELWANVQQALTIAHRMQENMPPMPATAAVTLS